MFTRKTGKTNKIIGQTKGVFYLADCHKDDMITISILANDKYEEFDIPIEEVKTTEEITEDDVRHKIKQILTTCAI